MQDSINILPLMDEAAFAAALESDDIDTMVRVNHVSMIFNIANQRLNNLKEYAIALAKRQLMFKEFCALDDVSLDIKRGDVFGILGTNGSGKSTLLKIIAGVLEPSRGNVEVNGHIAPLIELGAGFDPELTARENMYLNGALLGYSRAFIAEHFEEIVEFAEIGDFLDMPIKNYSSGMVARIAFAMATVIIPEILIVDEVLSVGDFMFQQKCERRIQELIKEHGVTVLIVSHSNDQIERLCNKAVWIEKGHVRMMGDAHEVCTIYRALGGHSGSAESEHTVLSMINSPLETKPSSESLIIGENRYGIAAKLMTLCRFKTTSTVILASGEDFCSAMIAEGLAGGLACPMLLTKPHTIPDVTLQSLAHYKPERLIWVGLASHLNQTLTEELESFRAQGVDVVFLCEPGLEALSVSVYQFGATQGQKPIWGRDIILAHQGSVAELLTFSPYFYAHRAPVLINTTFEVMSTVTSLLDAHIASILIEAKPEHLIVLSGVDCMPEYFFDDMDRDAIARFVDDGPYKTNQLINNWISANGGVREGFASENSEVIVSYMWNAYNALCAGIYAASINATMVLIDPQNLDSVAHCINYIGQHAHHIRHLTFLGNTTTFTPLDRDILLKALVNGN